MDQPNKQASGLPNSNPLHSTHSQARAREHFDRFVTTKDGYIDVQELQQLVFALGEALTDKETQQFIKQTENLGTISFGEFYRWFTSPERALGTAADFVKLKLKSKAYMKNISDHQKKFAQVEFAEDDQINLNLNLTCGNIQEIDRNLEIKWEPNTNETERDMIILSFKAATCVETKKNIHKEFEEGIQYINKAFSQDATNIFDKIEGFLHDNVFDIHFTLKPDSAKIARSFKETSKIKGIDIKLTGDTKNGNGLMHAKVEVGKNLIDFIEGLGLPNDFSHALKQFSFANIDLGFKSMENIQALHPSIATLVKLLHTDANNIVMFLVLEFLTAYPSTRGLYSKIIKCFDAFKGLQILIGKDRLNVNFLCAGLFEKLKAEMNHLPEIRLRDVPDNLPAEVKTSMHECTLVLDQTSNDGFGCECGECGCFTFGPVYTCKKCCYSLEAICAINHMPENGLQHPLHIHPVYKSNGASGWTCDGSRVSNGCKGGFGEKDLISQECEKWACPLCDFHLCEQCKDNNKPG